MKIIFVDEPHKKNKNGVGFEYITKTQIFGGTFREFLKTLHDDKYLIRNNAEGIYVYDISHSVTVPSNNNPDTVNSMIFIRYAPVINKI